MADSTPSPAVIAATEEDPLAFSPVATHRQRRDGWTPERQRRFIDALAAIGNVSRAARAVGMSIQSAYRLRARPDAGDFASAWDTAVGMAHDRLYALALDRALNGYQVPRFYRGKQIGTIHRLDNRLMLAALAATTAVAPPPAHVPLEDLVRRIGE